jgi:hypothetical protein
MAKSLYMTHAFAKCNWRNVERDGGCIAFQYKEGMWGLWTSR